ncbi:choloylglycine hydrolase [Legionella antarctica]|uniref:Choloylglycine hydrolase n=1 Tax=Legionella antarctica TaxID=2708020 RepID=A0A6F8T9H4_9GAMM|nr:linear amide C-N hydrolase [Legionella antarctica]BCA97101.1 choloylglycine hydrolase [Legionella antarctica]
MNKFSLLKKLLLLCSALLLIPIPETLACTRAVYLGSDDLIITGRSMDWMENMHSSIWVFPKGMKRDGLAGPDSPKWTSKYGSVITSVYDIATADGMNERGLVMNMLYLAESDFGSAKKGNPPLSVSVWGQYALDNFATVSEAVDAMSQTIFQIIAPNLPNGTPSQVHLSLSDSSGDSAIFEYVGGELVIHHGKQYQVMTNSPIYSKQLALNEYWQEINGDVFLPGTSRAADRFARASFLIQSIPKKISSNYIQGVPEQAYTYQAIASVLGVMRSVSVPLGITTPNKPNIASTLYRTISDQKNRVYYFDSSTYPSTIWIDLKNLNFSQDAPVLSLAVENGHVHSGEVSSLLKPTKPFDFLPAN